MIRTLLALALLALALLALALLALALLALALLAAPWRAQAQPQVLVTLQDFESPADAEAWKARAAQYEEYVASVLDQPAFVGTHWFQFIDEPLAGRSFDGENYNIGLVDTTDTPYPEMIQAATRVHSTMYERRAAKVSAPK